MKLKNICTTCVVVSLAACAAPSVKPLTTPSGQKGYLVSCDGSADDWATCYAEAAKACNGKYMTIDKNESSTATAYGPLVRRNLIIECKAQ